VKLKNRARAVQVGPIRSFEDVKKHIDRSSRPNLKACRAISFSGWEAELLVVRAYEALMEMNPGEILRCETNHITSYPDVHAWVGRNPDFVLLGEDYKDKTIIYYLTRVRRGERPIDV